jgi:hypothetical protein
MYSVPIGFAPPVHQGSDAVRIAESEHAGSRDHRHRRIAAPAAPMHTGDGTEDILVVDTKLALKLKLVGQDVQQYLGVGLGIEVSQILGEEIAFEILGIREVAVVRENDPVRRVDVEGLRLGRACRAGCRIADMPDTHVAAQLDHVRVRKTSRARPLSLRRCSLSPWQVTMPAASCPRC